MSCIITVLVLACGHWGGMRGAAAGPEDQLDSEAHTDLQPLRELLDTWRTWQPPPAISAEEVRRLVRLFSEMAYYRRASAYIIERSGALDVALPTVVSTFRESMGLRVGHVERGLPYPATYWQRLACLDVLAAAGPRAAEAVEDVICLLRLSVLEAEDVAPAKGGSTLLTDTLAALCANQPEVVAEGMKDSEPRMREKFCRVAGQMPASRRALGPPLVGLLTDPSTAVVEQAGSALCRIEWIPDEALQRVRSRIARTCSRFDRRNLEVLLQSMREVAAVGREAREACRRRVARAYDRAVEELSPPLLALWEVLAQWQTWEKPPALSLDQVQGLVHLLGLQRCFRKAAAYMVSQPEMFEAALPAVVRAFRASLENRVERVPVGKPYPSTYWLRLGCLAVLDAAGPRGEAAIPDVVRLHRLMTLEGEEVRYCHETAHVITTALASITAEHPDVILRGLRDPSAAIRFQYCITARSVRVARDLIFPTLVGLLNDPHVDVALKAGCALCDQRWTSSDVLARIEARAKGAATALDQRDFRRLHRALLAVHEDK